MKTLLFLLLLAFGLTCHSAFAQHAKPGNPPPGPAGLPPGELFVGTWQWSSGNEVFRMTLVRDPNWTMNGITRNVLTGQHRYTRNGVVRAVSRLVYIFRSDECLTPRPPLQKGEGEPDVWNVYINLETALSTSMWPPPEVVIRTPCLGFQPTAA